MNRKAARAAVKAALIGLGSYKLVSSGAVDTFGGKTPAAIVTSASIERVQGARMIETDLLTITVSIYVERPADAGEATEDTLDDLALATIGAIDGLENTIVFSRSDAGSGGAPNRIIDSKVYRVERISFVLADEVSE